VGGSVEWWEGWGARGGGGGRSKRGDGDRGGDWGIKRRRGGWVEVKGGRRGGGRKK